MVYTTVTTLELVMPDLVPIILYVVVLAVDSPEEYVELPPSQVPGVVAAGLVPSVR